ncbi:MAG: DUF4293 domain-containing protein [Crocinitomicaceae bacterium]
MIQRKQTIYFLLAFVCMILLLFFPMFNIETVQQGEVLTGTFTAYGFQTEDGQTVSFPLYLLFMAMALITAICVFLYKNRKRQLMVGRLNLILHLLVTVAFAIFFYAGRSLVVQNTVASTMDEVSFSVGIGFFFLVGSIPFLILAIRGIKQDEELLRSIDRIR